MPREDEPIALNVDAANEMLKWRASVRELLDDLLDYFEPKIDAEVEGDRWNAQTLTNKEMDFYMRIKEVRGDR